MEIPRVGKKSSPESDYFRFIFRSMGKNEVKSKYGKIEENLQKLLWGSALGCLICNTPTFGRTRPAVRLCYAASIGLEVGPT